MGDAVSLIDAAKKAHPAFRYPIVGAGMMGLVALFLRFGISLATLCLGVSVLLVLMIAFLVFYRLSILPARALALPAQVALWTTLMLVLSSLALLFSSTFFDSPLPIKSLLLARDESMPKSPQAIGGIPFSSKANPHVISVSKPGSSAQDATLSIAEAPGTRVMTVDMLLTTHWVVVSIVYYSDAQLPIERSIGVPLMLQSLAPCQSHHR